MMKLSHVFLSVIIFVGCLINSMAFTQAPAVTPLSDEAKKAMIQENTALLDKMVGTWKADHVRAEGKVQSELKITKIINGLFYEGQLISKDEKGAVIYEARIILSFNYGGLKYLMSLFESTGWAKQFLGEPDPNAVVLKGMTPKGMEMYRWQIKDNKLERSYWSPSQAMQTTNPPDDTVVFSKVN